MKPMNQTNLLRDLQADVRALLATVEKIRYEDPDILVTRPAPDKWSVVQVLEHLNSYGRYYLPALQKALRHKKPFRGEFRPGWLGDYFTRLMKPDPQGKIRSKMSAPSQHIPDDRLDAYPVIRTFIDQQHQLLQLLESALDTDLGAVRVPISLTRLIRLKLGDTFRFLIAHEQRHLVQVQNILAVVREQAGARAA